MGPKYEFTGETKKKWDFTLHRIRRLSDDKLGGWIESEDNLSQEGNCWVDDEAMVYDGAQIYGNAQVYGNAIVDHWAKVYGNAKVYDNAIVDHHANVYDNVQIYGNATVFQYAKVSGNAEVYDNARVYGIRVHVYDNAKIYGHAEIKESEVYDNAQVYGSAYVIESHVYGYMKINSGKYTDEDYEDDYEEDYEDDLLEDSETGEAIQDFIYKVNDSNKLTTQTEYDSVDEFFSEPITNDIKLDTLIICAVDTKEPLIKLQKVKTEDRTEFKFIVDIIDEDGDNFIFKSVIKSRDQLNRLIQQTVEALKNYSKFGKYADDLEDYLK